MTIKVKAPNGLEMEVSEKAFDLFYRPAGFRLPDEPGGAAPSKNRRGGKAQDRTAAESLTESGEHTAETLGKLKKAELVAIAQARGVEVVPDAMTNKQIIAAILGNEEQ